MYVQLETSEMFQTFPFVFSIRYVRSLLRSQVLTEPSSQILTPYRSVNILILQSGNEVERKVTLLGQFRDTGRRPHPSTGCQFTNSTQPLAWHHHPGPAGSLQDLLLHRAKLYLFLRGFRSLEARETSLHDQERNQMSLI